MLQAVKADIDLSEPFLIISVSSTGNENLRIVCFSKNYIVKASFEHFEGLENRSEFFDRRDATGINTPPLPDSPYYYPISYIAYDQFKNTLSGYESTKTFDKTKLWRFLSVENFVEVYSTNYPKLEKIERDNSGLFEKD